MLLWLAVCVCSELGVGLGGLGMVFWLCVFEGVRVRRAVYVCQLCCERARASAEGVGECCVRCGECGELGCGAL